MRILSIIQPSEMGSDFHFDEEAGLWKVNFPAGMGEGGGVPLSTDENNAIVLGSDEGAFISADLLGAYALTQDNGSKKINLYRFQPGTEFNPETATLVSSVNMIELSGIFDDVAIDGDLITFTDADTGLTLTIDTANLQKVSDIVGSDSVEVNSLGGLTTLSVRINPNPDNLIKVTEEGLFVDAASFSGEGELDLHQTLAQVEEGLCHVVGNSHLVVPQIELTDVAGNPIGYINDIIGLPVSSQTHGPDHCPKWEPPAVNNCRVGKVAVAFVPNFMYGTNPEDSSLEWRIFMNGEDTGYIAAVDMSQPPVTDQPMVMSITQNDFGDGNDFKGKGWLQDIISEATNGAVSGSYRDGAILLNETNQQVILTLVPNRPITLDEVRFVYNSDEGRNIYELTLDQLTANLNSPPMGPPMGPGPILTMVPMSLDGDMVPMNVSDSVVEVSEKVPVEAPMEDFPTVAKLEDYFDEATGVINICLAPNNAGGGSTGPQISCAGATDRFATSGLWYNWTVKLNGKTLIENARYSDVIQALESNGIRVDYAHEMRTTYRNLTNGNIRLEFIAGTPDNYWDQIYLELDNSTNPTLMGYDPLQNNAEGRMMAFGSLEGSQEPERYQRITVCLAPADDWMNWDYRDIDTSTAVITLRNSVNLIGANQGFRIEGEHNLVLETDVDEWGDLTWTIRANSPDRREVTLTIDYPDYQDEYTVDFFARKPMIVTLANVHEYARPFNVYSGLEEATEITAIEVVTKLGSTLISNLEDAMTIDAVVGAIRIDSLEDGLFSHIVQGRFVDAELSDKVKVTFTTTSGENHVVEVNVATNDSSLDYEPISNDLNSTVTIGLVDTAGYTDVRTLPGIRIVSPDWSETYLNRINMVGGEATMEFDFSQRSTYKLYIHAYLGTGFGHLAILGDCVVGVDDWGDLEAEGYTFDQETYAKRFGQDSSLDFLTVSKNNLSYVPKEGPSNLRNMTGMFAGTDLSDPSVDLSGYDVSGVYSMAGVFAHSNFNGNILSWNMRWVGNLDYAFYASKFRQDLSLWCVSSIRQEPKLFSHRTSLLAKHKPVWGTCPLEDNTSQVTLRNSAGYGAELYKAAIPNDYSRDNPAIYSSKYIALMCYKPLLLIGDRAFKDQLISRLSFIPNLKQIGEEAFMNNQLETVTIYGGITKIGDRAFAGNPLRFVGVIENTPPVLGVDAIPASVEGIYVPDSAVAKYKSANGWSNYAGVIKPLSTAPGVIYTVMYDETKPETKYTLYFIDTVIPAEYLQNNRVTVNSINEGVVRLADNALFGTEAGELVIPASLKTVDGEIRISSKILRFADGFDFEVIRDKRIALTSDSTLILPPNVTDINWFLSPNQIGTIVCPSQTPPLLYNQPYNTRNGVTTIYTSFGLVASNKKPTRAIYVPADSIDAYRADPVWSKLTDNFLPIEEFEYGLVTDAEITYTADDGSWTEVVATARVEDAGKTGNVILLTGVLVNGYYEWFERARTDAVVNSQGKFLGRVTIPTQYKDDPHAWVVSVGGGNRFQVVG